MNQMHLNLARKWRSKNFDQIIGQDLSLRMLKNSLYLGQFFPVYLFSGQRGCGKTSTARVFSAAINCQNLADFKKDPKNNVVPCLECTSCKAMTAGKHPDFIEIDAASHTGVDNVRSIIDAASLLPSMGKKKIYLIDEAHMLSKAAFNAFLKILEEPPSSVLFILATTDPQKIITTVKSRCFQILFKPVQQEALMGHLQAICKKEGISYQDSGLELIIQETQGSVRDALNLIEQVRFAHSSLTKKTVSNVLGYIDDAQMLQLFSLFLQGQPKKLLAFLQKIKFETVSAEFIWKKCLELLRVSIWLKYGVKPDWSVDYSKQLLPLIKNYSVKQLNSMIEFLYKNEAIFLKTTAKHSLLEMLLLQLCKTSVDDSSSSGSSGSSAAVAAPVELEGDDEEFEDEDDEEYEDEAQGKWKNFLNELDTLNNNLLSSIFKNGKFISFDSGINQLKVSFSKKFSFFKDSIEDHKNEWLPLLHKNFSQNVQFLSDFDLQQDTPSRVITANKSILVTTVAIDSAPKKETPSLKQNVYKPAPARSNSFSYARKNNRSEQSFGKKIDVSDATIWKKSALLTQRGAASGC